MASAMVLANNLHATTQLAEEKQNPKAKIKEMARMPSQL